MVREREKRQRGSALLVVENQAADVPEGTDHLVTNSNCIVDPCNSINYYMVYTSRERSEVWSLGKIEFRLAKISAGLFRRSGFSSSSPQ